MKRLAFLILTLIIFSGSMFSQEVTYSSLIKQSLDSLTVKLVIKERDKSYYTAKLILKQLENNNYEIPPKTLSAYFNESFSKSTPELNSAYKEYLRINNQFVNYFRGNKDFEKIEYLPTNNAENIKIRNDQLSAFRSKFFQSDSTYKRVFLSNNRNVNNYEILILKHLLSYYTNRNEIFPLSLFGNDPVINTISANNANIYSLNQEIEVIKNLINQMNYSYLNDALNTNNYSKAVIDSLINVQNDNRKKVLSIPTKMILLLERFTKVITDQNEMIFDKYIAMRIADSSTISIYSYPASKADGFVYSVDSLKKLRLDFDKKNIILTNLLNTDIEYAKLLKKTNNREIGSDVFIKESSIIINKRFRYEQAYINARSDYDRTLFKSNLAILRHLIKTSNINGYPLDFRIIPGNELQQIKSSPEIYIIENEIINFKNIIRSSWYTYYSGRYAIPHIKMSRNEILY